MGRGKGKGTPQVRKLTKRQKAAAADTTNALRGMERIVVGGIVKWRKRKK
jgi:hypothetical protein